MSGTIFKVQFSSYFLERGSLFVPKIYKHSESQEGGRKLQIIPNPNFGNKKISIFGDQYLKNHCCFHPGVTDYFRKSFFRLHLTPVEKSHLDRELMSKPFWMQLLVRPTSVIRYSNAINFV